MSIQIGNHQFSGPFVSIDQIADRAGVYTILDRRASGELFVVDVGESAQVQTRLRVHERESCWRQNSLGTIQYAVLYTPLLSDTARWQIEQQLRDQYAPACGVR